MNFLFRHILMLLTITFFAFTEKSTAQITPYHQNQLEIHPVVVIVSLAKCCEKEAWPEAEERISREFLQANIEVIIIDGKATTEHERRQELITIAEEYEAAATIRISKSPLLTPRAGVDLWINDRITNKTVYRYLPIDDIKANESPIIAGLKTMELFRASLQEIQVSQSPTPKLPKQIEDIRDLPPSAADRKLFVIGAGLSGISFARDIKLRGAPVLMFGWCPTKHFQLHLEGWFGIMGKDIVNSDESSSVKINTLLLKPMLVTNIAPIIKTSLGLTLGTSIIKVKGQSPDPLVERNDHMITFFLGISAQLGFELTKNIWVTPTFDFGFIIPQAKIMFHDNEIAHFGFPIFKSGLLFEVYF